jgi:peptide/nickel transport system substrate-binding protein
MLVRQRTVVCAALAAASLALPACAGTGDGGSGGDARKGGSITIAATKAPDSLDPAVSRSPEARQALWLVYTAPLTLRRAEGAGGTELKPGLAEDMPEISEDGTIYTFKIREGLRYSNRRPVRASDFEYTVKRVLNLRKGASLFTVIDGAKEYMKGSDESADISGIQADDKKREVTVQLTGRDPTFLNKLATTFAGMVPSGTRFADLSSKPPAGVGPYTITKVKPGHEFVMAQTRGFHVGDIPEGNVQRITTRVVRDAKAQTEGVVKGTFDYMQGSPPVKQLPEIRSKYKDRYKERATLNTLWFFLNERTPPFDNEKVRKAVNVALDKSAIVRIYAGLLEPTCNFLPRGIPGFNRIDPCPWGDPALNGDPQRARQLVESSGEDGKEVTVVTDRKRRHRQVARYYAGLLDKIGLDAKVKVVDRLRGARRGRAQTGVSSYRPELPHPQPFMTRLDGDVTDPSIEEKQNELLLEPDVDKAADGYAELDRMIVEHAYTAPFGVERQSTFLSERMDRENCSRVNPMYGAEYSSFCLK